MIKTLYTTPFLSLKENDGFYYSHENRCNGQIVSILPYHIVNGELEFLLRFEPNPAWDKHNNIIATITGAMERSTSIIHAVEELEEEAGYFVDENELISLGWSRGSKSSDTIYYLFSVDLTGKTRYTAKGDGSYFESKSYCFWSKNIEQAHDPLVHCIYFKLNNLKKRSSYE